MIKEKKDLDYHCSTCHKDYKMNPAVASTNILCPGCQNPMDLVNEGLAGKETGSHQIDDFKENAKKVK